MVDHHSLAINKNSHFLGSEFLSGGPGKSACLKRYIKNGINAMLFMSCLTLKMTTIAYKEMADCANSMKRANVVDVNKKTRVVEACVPLLTR